MQALREAVARRLGIPVADVRITLAPDDPARWIAHHASVSAADIVAHPLTWRWPHA